MIRGLYTAIVTPFKDGVVDEDSFIKLVDRQVKAGVAGIVPCGTTGESPTLTHDEHNKVVELAIKSAQGKIQVMAGTGSNSTDEAIEMTHHAEKAGADSALIVAPYYNKPTQEGVYLHYKAIAQAVGIPIIIYNIPGRSVIDISDDTIARLAEIRNIVGIKDATGDLARVSTLRMKLGADFIQLSGEDATAVAFNAQGGVGCLSVTANIVPELCRKIQDLTLAGDYKEALAVHDRVMPLNNVMFCETNPAPVKYALSLLNLCSEEVRLPLAPISQSAKSLIRNAIDEFAFA